MSARSLAFYRHEHEHHSRLRYAFKTQQSRVYTISLIGLAFSLVCLMWDLSSPGRALLLFTRPHFTVLTFGAFVLVIELLLGAILTVANLFNAALLGGRMKKTLEILCCICSVAVMTYTGVFLASNASIPFWNTWTLVGLFFFSSLSSGVSTVLLVDYFVQDQMLLLRAARSLQKVHLVCLAFETVFLSAFLYVGFTNPNADRSLSLLFDPTIFSTGVVGVLTMGIVVPLILESYVLLTKECRTIPVSDVVCLIGAFCLRWCIIACGAR